MKADPKIHEFWRRYSTLCDAMKRFEDGEISNTEVLREAKFFAEAPAYPTHLDKIPRDETKPFLTAVDLMWLRKMGVSIL